MLIRSCPRCRHTNFSFARLCGGCGVLLKHGGADSHLPWMNLLGVFLLCMALCAAAAGGLYMLLRNAAPVVLGLFDV